MFFHVSFLVHFNVLITTSRTIREEVACTEGVLEVSHTCFFCRNHAPYLLVSFSPLSLMDPLPLLVSVPPAVSLFVVWWSPVAYSPTNSVLTDV